MVADCNAFVVAEEEDRMLAGFGSAAQGMDADLFSACPGDSLTAVDFLKLAVRVHDLKQRLCSSARGILLLVVMGLRKLHVERVLKQWYCSCDQLAHHRDTVGEVGTVEYGNGL